MILGVSKNALQSLDLPILRTLWECDTVEQCFPKSGPRTFFGPPEFLIWSARKKLLLILYLKSINHKICQFFYTKFHYLVRRKNFMDYVVRQIFFQCFMVRKPKKFGKHCCRGTVVSLQTPWRLLKVIHVDLFGQVQNLLRFCEFEWPFKPNRYMCVAFFSFLFCALTNFDLPIGSNGF